MIWKQCLPKFEANEMWPPNFMQPSCPKGTSRRSQTCMNVWAKVKQRRWRTPWVWNFDLNLQLGPNNYGNCCNKNEWQWKNNDIINRKMGGSITGLISMSFLVESLATVSSENTMFKNYSNILMILISFINSRGNFYALWF